MSNWERRPLSQVQLHYAAADAYILVRIIHELATKGEEQGKPLKRFVRDIDKVKVPELCAQASDMSLGNSLSGSSTGSNTLPDELKSKGFIPSASLTPDLIARGFIVDKYTANIAKRL